MFWVNALSLFVIAVLSGTIQTPLFLLGFTIVHYGLSHFVSQRSWVYGLTLAWNALGFVLLQRTGWIGVLDANSALNPTTLPLLMGFSFYVLQALAIQGAIYRGVIKVMPFNRFLLALSFCGAFLAGPIFNQDQLKQMETFKLRLAKAAQVYQLLPYLVGAVLFKYVFASWLSQWVRLDDMRSPLFVARSVACFELQVYFDFAGYSLLAYFMCKLFNIPIYHNFQQPFAARDIPEFWRRWHVGLGTFFKENLFQPLKSLLPQPWASRLMIPVIVFSVSAAWHGPTGNFLLWGLFHGLNFALAVVLLRHWGKKPWTRIIARVQMFAVLFYGRLLFMETDLQRLSAKFQELGRFRKLGSELMQLAVDAPALLSQFTLRWDDVMVFIGAALLLGYELTRSRGAQQGSYSYLRPGVWAFVLFLFALLFFQPITQHGFVYGR